MNLCCFENRGIHWSANSERHVASEWFNERKREGERKVSIKSGRRKSVISAVVGAAAVVIVALSNSLPFHLSYLITRFSQQIKRLYPTLLTSSEINLS